jgi:hypothetical protein
VDTQSGNKVWIVGGADAGKVMFSPPRGAVR